MRRAEIFAAPAVLLLLSACATTAFMQDYPEMVCTPRQIEAAKQVADQRIRAHGYNPVSLLAQAPSGSCARLKFYQDLARRYP